MKRKSTILTSRRAMIVASLLCISFLTACAPSGNVAVSIHGVNYSDQEFRYVLRDPANPTNEGGGESVDRFAAGGTMCCFSLPRKWKPEIKINIDYEYYLPKTPDGNLPKITKSTVADLPQYIEPGDLWVLRNADGTMSLVSSNYQPDHPKWEGKVKGWPVPSLAYQRERWSLYMEHELGGVALFEKLLKDLQLNPEKELKEAWDYQITYIPELKLKFKGASDPDFLVDLKQRYENSLVRSRGLVRQLEESKP